MTPVLQIVANTPIWVWVLLAYLLFIGIRALRPSTAPLWRIAILPMVFFVWGLASLYQMHGLASSGCCRGRSRSPWASASAC